MGAGSKQPCYGYLQGEAGRKRKTNLFVTQRERGREGEREREREVDREDTNRVHSSSTLCLCVCSFAQVSVYAHMCLGVFVRARVRALCGVNVVQIVLLMAISWRELY